MPCVFDKSYIMEKVFEISPDYIPKNCKVIVIEMEFLTTFHETRFIKL
jgi:hypothetical protein